MMPYANEEEFVRGQKGKLRLTIFLLILVGIAHVAGTDFPTMLVGVLVGLLYLHRHELAPRWKHIEDLDRPGDTYLSRLFLVKRQWIGVYLHIIRRDDWSRCQHDHPWAFITAILAGGYEEEVGGKVYVRLPGYVGYRPRAFEHRITKLTTGRAITLVVRFNDHVEWNFRTRWGKMNWREYLNLPGATRVAWCDDSLPGRE